MRRTYEEWRQHLGGTVSNMPKNGAQWAIVTLLYEIALILLDVREAFQIMITDNASRAQTQPVLQSQKAKQR